MIVTKKNMKQGIVSLKISLSDDIWYLSQLIEPCDTVTAKTERKLKIGDAQQGNAKTVRKTLTLSVRVEDVALSEEGDLLRVKGKVEQGTEDVPAGLYHTLNLAVDTSFTLFKPEWSPLMKNRLDEAVKNSSESVLFILFDREKTLFSIVRQTGIDHLFEMKNGISGKQYAASSKDDVYDSIISSVHSVLASHALASIVVGCPYFWKPYLENAFKASSISKKPLFVTLTTVDRSMVARLLSRPELHSLLHAQRLKKERAFIDRLLEQLDKSMIVYGFSDVENASSMGAVSELGVTNSFIKECKQEGEFDRLNTVLSSIDSSRGDIHMIKEDNAAKTVNGLGGIVGILRWKIQ